MSRRWDQETYFHFDSGKNDYLNFQINILMLFSIGDSLQSFNEIWAFVLLSHWKSLTVILKTYFLLTLSMIKIKCTNIEIWILSCFASHQYTVSTDFALIFGWNSFYCKMSLTVDFVNFFKGIKTNGPTKEGSRLKNPFRGKIN